MLFRRKEPLLRGYVSDIDRLLQEPVASSKSIEREELKYRIIAEKRDNPKADGDPERIWEDF